MTLLFAAIALGILIFVHELGHFLLAKWNGVAVLEFAIGFGKPILRFQRGETTYALRLIPLGGFVRMAGDDLRLLEESDATNSATDAEGALTGFDAEAAARNIPRERWFLNKGFFAKSAIVIAGPLFNVLFAILFAFASLVAFGRSEIREESIIGVVFPNLPAEKAGFLPGDKVVSIDGQRTELWGELSSVIIASQGKPLNIEVERTGEQGEVTTETLTVQATKESGELAILEGSSEPSYRIGIAPATRKVECSVGEALPLAVDQIVAMSVLTVRGIAGMIRGLISPTNIGGPILIFKEGAAAADRGIEPLLNFMIWLSISLAILNLLPIPILDGGHLLFFIIEAIKGSRLSLKTYERANQVGMALLLLLMVFAVGNDLIRVVESF